MDGQEGVDWQGQGYEKQDIHFVAKHLAAVTEALGTALCPYSVLHFIFLKFNKSLKLKLFHYFSHGGSGLWAGFFSLGYFQ